MLGNCNGEYGIVADYYGIGVGDYDGGDGSYFYAIPENSPAMVLRTASTGIETTTKGMNVLGLINIDDNYDFQIGFGKDGNEEEGKIYGIINETLNRTEMAIAAGGVTASTYYEGRILLGGYGSTANNKAQLWIGNDAASSLTEADFTFKVASGGGADNLFMKLDKNGLWFNNDADSGILMTTEDKTQFQIAGGVDVTIQADLLKLETGTELGYDGAAAPFSQTAITDALQTGFAHICEGGHPENPYPRTRNTLDSEFNNAAAADNNDVTDTGGGGTWDFDAAPNAYGVGSGEYDSHLYVRTNNEIRYATRSIPRLGVDDIKVVRMYVHQVTCNWFQPWRLIIRFHDSVNSTYAGLQLETNSTADNVLVSAIHDLGGGAVTSVAAYLGGNFMGPFTMCVKRYESANNAYYRAMFGMGHDGYSNNDWINIAGVGADTNFRPDQVRIFFQSYGATYTTFYIDSVRFEDA
jgi:hypothetical protein